VPTEFKEKEAWKSLGNWETVATRQEIGWAADRDQRASGAAKKSLFWGRENSGKGKAGLHCNRFLDGKRKQVERGRRNPH